MAEYFAGGHLRFVNDEWRDDNGDAIEISPVRHGRWVEKEKYTFGIMYDCSLYGILEKIGNSRKENDYG